MFVIKDIKLPVSSAESGIKALCAKKLKTTQENIKEIKIIKKSIDARKKDNVVFVYSVLAEAYEKRGINGEVYKPAPRIVVAQKKLPKRPVIAGFGPAGMFAGLILAKAGCKPVIIERGRRADERAHDVRIFARDGILNPESNIQFGEGGAGTFSDGKLTTGISSPLVREVYETFAENGAGDEILYSAKPHIGSDVLPTVVSNIRKKIESFGGEVRFGAKLEDIKISDSRISSVVLGGEEIETDNLLLGIGHSARDTFEMLYKKGVLMVAKPFSVGVRIEHLQKDINTAQYARFAKFLGAADYKLSTHLNGLGVYTFCMCPGGYVTGAASEEGGVVTNGHSLHSRGGLNSNSALLVSVSPAVFENDAMKGIEFQRKIERAAYFKGYKAPCQLVGDFLQKKESKSVGDIQPTYAPGVVIGSIEKCLPGFVCDALREAIKIFDGRIEGFARYDALLTAPETRSSSPVRILRDGNGQSSIRGIYPIGEGSGYAGGITSSAVDGIRAALAVTSTIQ